MGVPKRFAVEYPDRCLQLVAAAEPFAIENKLTGSFALLVAAAVLTMPFERMRATHFLFQPEDADLSAALKSLTKAPFLQAPFWSANPTDWRQSRIMEGIDHTGGWKDANGRHPADPESENSIAQYCASEVLRVIRNALSHGNIVYLNKNGYEVPGDQMESIAFLSRYEEDPNAKEFTYRVVIAPEMQFLIFVKDWAKWISSFAKD